MIVTDDGHHNFVSGLVDFSIRKGRRPPTETDMRWDLAGRLRRLRRLFRRLLVLRQVPSWVSALRSNFLAFLPASMTTKWMPWD